MRDLHLYPLFQAIIVAEKGRACKTGPAKIYQSSYAKNLLLFSDKGLSLMELDAILVDHAHFETLWRTAAFLIDLDMVPWKIDRKEVTILFLSSFCEIHTGSCEDEKEA